jgi:hypothetical protein
MIREFLTRALASRPVNPGKALAQIGAGKRAREALTDRERFRVTAIEICRATGQRVPARFVEG